MLSPALMSNFRVWKVTGSAFYLGLMLVGSVILAAQYWVVFKFEAPLWFVGDAILFGGAILLAPAFMRKGNAQSSVPGDA